MKALPLWQPWASLVACGAKTVDTRHWPAPGWLIGQRIAIHATKTKAHLRVADLEPFDRRLRQARDAGRLVHVGGDLPLGAIVATAVLKRCGEITEEGAARLFERRPDEYAFGNYDLSNGPRFAWVLHDVERLERPVPWKGSQGIFDVPDRLLGYAAAARGDAGMTSGLRSPAENARVGGATNSDHLTGKAIGTLFDTPAEPSPVRDRGATLSECGRYRYSLWRRWDWSKRSVVFVMLNPSTADALQDDPTIRRCVGFAKSWGAGGIRVVNLYAWRATDPRDLGRAPANPVGEAGGIRNRNDLAILSAVADAGRVIAAWGANAGPYPMRTAEVLQLLSGRRVEALTLTKDGRPAHPLRLRGDLVPIVYREASGG